VGLRAQPITAVANAAVRIVRRMIAHNAFEASAAVAFWFFLSLIPLLVLVGFLVGQVARTRGVDALVGPLLEVIPTTAEDIVSKAVERLAGGGASAVAPLGVAGYLWTSSAGLHNLMDVFEKAANGTRRPWWKQRAMALGWVVFGLLVACLLASLLVAIDSAFHAYPHRSPGRVPGAPRRAYHRESPAPGEQAIAATLTLAIGTAVLGGFYRVAVEHSARVRRSVWPGAFAAVVSWLVVSWAFGVYAVSIANYTLYYGSLAAVAVLLIWLYLTSLALAVGAEVNAHVEAGRRRGSGARPSAVPRMAGRAK
jgi:membrane protein